MSAPDPTADSDTRQAAINHGAIDADAVVAMLGEAKARLGNTFAAQTIDAQLASIRASHPAVFHKRPQDMTPAEYAARKAGLFGDERARQRAATEARTLERITKKYQK